MSTTTTTTTTTHRRAVADESSQRSIACGCPLLPAVYFRCSASCFTRRPRDASATDHGRNAQVSSDFRHFTHAHRTGRPAWPARSEHSRLLIGRGECLSVSLLGLLAKIKVYCYSVRFCIWAPPFLQLGILCVQVAQPSPRLRLSIAVLGATGGPLIRSQGVFRHL